MDKEMETINSKYSKQILYAALYGFLQSVAPRRVDMLANPPDDLSPDDWLEKAKMFARAGDDPDAHQIIDKVKLLVDQEKYIEAYDLVVTKHG